MPAIAPEGDETVDLALLRIARLAANSTSTTSAALIIPGSEGGNTIITYGDERLVNDTMMEVAAETLSSGRHRFTTDVDAQHEEPYFVACEPVRNLREEVVAVLAVADYGTRTGSPHLRNIVQDLAAVAAEAMEGGSGPRPRTSPIDAVFSIVVSTLDSINTGSLTLRDVMKLVIEQSVKLTSGFGAAVGLVDADELVFRAASPAVAAIRGTTLSVADSHVGHCVQTGRMLLCRDVDKDRTLNHPIWEQVGARSLATVPLNYRSVTMGVLTVFGDRANSFTQSDVRILEQLAMLIAVAIERSRSMQALRDSEGRYQALIQHTAEAIYFACPHSGRILEANPAFFSLLGYDPEDLEALTIIDFVDHSASDISGRLEQVLSERFMFLDRKWRTKDGRRIDVQATVSVIDHDGRELLFVVARDITAQKAAEVSRRKSERKYRDLFERANVPVLIFRPENEEVIDANQQALVEYDFERHELIGRSLKSLTADVSRGEQEMHHILTQGGTQNFETVHYRKDRTPFHLLVSCSLIDYDGDTAVLMFGRNITDRKRTERLLTESESRLRAVTENALDLIGILDARGRIKYMAGPIEELLGLDSRNVRSNVAMDRVHPEDLSLVRRSLIETQQHPERLVNVEFRLRHADGSWRHLSLKGRNLTNTPGVEGILVSMRDVTQRKHFEAELVEAKEKAEEMARLKSAFLANMSHEIRTPLTAILGFADVLAREVTGEHREFAELIQEGGQRLSETLNSVLDLARLEAGGFKPQFETIDAGEAVRSITGVFEALAVKKGIELKANVPSVPLQVSADRGALSRVLQNLIGNAIKFTDRGSVTVNLDRIDSWLQFHVIDTGSGIDSEFIPHLFEEFKQESTGLARSHEGTGLGLTITKRLIDLMEGEISVESEKGKGSTFTVRIPVGDGVYRYRQPDHPEEVSEADSLPDRMRVLIVEDNVYTRLLVNRLLKDTYEVTTAANAEEAYAIATGQDFDVLLMDINLGEGPNGLDLMHEIRKDVRFAQTPVVALTAYAMPEDRNRFLDAGFDYYLSKPFTKDDLRKTIAQALGC
jgi:PAS domain S-box-containing protein